MGILGFSNGIRRGAIKKEETAFDIADKEYSRQYQKTQARHITPSFTGGTVKREKMPNPLQIAKQRQKEARLGYLESVSSGNRKEEKARLKQYKKEGSQLKAVEKAEKERREEKFKTANAVLGLAFSSRREYGRKPKKLRSKPARGIYKNPFRR